MRTTSLARAAPLAAALAASCAPAAAPTYHADVRPIVEQRCQSCHQPGGIGPIDLRYDEAAWEEGAPSWAP